ncbi:DUF835 domain-containing protein [Thermococcus sp. PK]|uniref:DUF835 domain-containing protein n=1 Tax=Thermococcus sp. PK TaxID=913025 RepID=UPI000693CD59|nr:DUF835 domain-containing protein [Thermococcus sp. PK]
MASGGDTPVILTVSANEKVKLLSAIPVIVSLYGALVDVLGLSSDWFALVGLSYAVSAFLMVISGLLIISLKTFYNKKALYLGSAVTLHGLHELDYPILRLVEWFAPIGFTLGAILALLVAYFMIRFVFTEQFIKGIKKPPVEVHFKPGVMMLMPEEYTTIKEKLEKIPVLGFVRDLNIPESWNVFFITSIEGRNSISPTNLARITDITVRYLKEAKEKGFGGTVVVDCPEYLKTYNGFEAIVKFLSALKDFTLFYGGVLILVIDEGAWEERELVTLKRVLT